MRTIRRGIGIAALSFLPAVAEAGLFQDVSLSPAAQSALVAHFDARVGVSTFVATNNVQSWQGKNGNGTATVATLTSAGDAGLEGNIKLVSAGAATLRFTDTTVASESRYLVGNLSTTAANQSYTVFWSGHYDPSDANGFANSGYYVYNIGGEISHQRDDGGGGYRLELFDGSTTYAADRIDSFDNLDTTWTTIYQPTSHSAFANDTDLHPTGTPNYAVPDDPQMVVGAFNTSSGFNFVGDVKQIVIFEGVLTPADATAIRGYLAAAAVPEPTTLFVCAVAPLAFFRRRR
jgi:hypothetical protein